jgi:hypothetical protein
MPSNKANRKIVEDYLESIKEKNLSAGTIKTYRFIADNLPFSITLAQKTIVTKLKDLYQNPNTLQLYLNLVILVRRFKDLPTDQLIKLRNGLKDDIKKIRNEKLDKLDDELPTLDYLKERLDKQEKVRYLVNYLFINHGLRNSDLDLLFVDKIPESSSDNLISFSNKGKTKVAIVINRYKTVRAHGKKSINIDDKRFIKELKDMELQHGQPVVQRKNGDRMTNVSTLNDRLKTLSIDKLGQNKIFKIVIRNLLNNNDFEKLDQYSRDRGTGYETLLKSYNLHMKAEDGSSEDEAQE